VTFEGRQPYRNHFPQVIGTNNKKTFEIFKLRSWICRLELGSHIPIPDYRREGSITCMKWNLGKRYVKVRFFRVNGVKAFAYVIILRSICWDETS